MAITTIADTNYLNDVYNSSALPYPQINIPVSIDAGCTMEIQNYSPFVLQIYNGKTLVESLPPYSWLICDYIDKATANIVSPASLPLATGAFITTNVLSQKMSRQRGDFTLPLTQTVNTPVITPTGQTLAVAGSMNVANVVSATITQAAGTSLSIGTVQSIVENVTTSANVVNDYITNNNLASAPPFTVNVTNLASGATITNISSTPLSQAGQFDGLYIRINSTQNQANNYTLTLNYTYLSHFGLTTNSNLTIQGSSTFQWGPRNNQVGITYPMYFNPQIMDSIVFTLQNTGTQTITSDTVTIQVYSRYASTEIINPTGNPVQSQQSVGEFDGQYPFTVANTTTSQIILHGSIGGYIKYLWITATNTSTSPEFFQITNGGNSIAEIYVPPATTANGNLGLLNIAMPFGTGILNGEVDIIPNNTGLSVIGYSIVAQQSGATIPTTLS